MSQPQVIIITAEWIREMSLYQNRNDNTVVSMSMAIITCARDPVKFKQYDVMVSFYG